MKPVRVPYLLGNVFRIWGGSVAIEEIAVALTVLHKKELNTHVNHILVRECFQLI